MEILKHNLKAAEKAITMLETLGKACVIHSTDVGKNHILSYIINNGYAGKKIAYFAPNYKILGRCKEAFKANGVNLDNITMVSLTNNILKYKNEMNFDLTIFDENHRCGANFPTKDINALLEKNKESKILVTTAASIMMLDKYFNTGIMPFSRIYKENLISVNHKVLTLIKFYKENGRHPRKNEEYEGIDLYDFIRRIRSQKTKLIDYDRELLENLGIRLTIIDQDKLIHEKILLLDEFYKKNRRTLRKNEKYKGVNLYHFVQKIRKGEIKIVDSDKKLLEDNKIGMTLIYKDKLIHEKVLLLVEFYEKNKRKPKADEKYKGINLYNFIYSIYSGKIKITDSDRKLFEYFEEILIPIKYKKSYHEDVLFLVKYYKENRRVPGLRKQYEGKDLGSFYYNLKNDKIKILEDDRKLLEKIGILFPGNN